MKKIALVISTFFITILSSSAQVEPHAIGLRFGGGNFGSGTELNYLHGIGDANRGELGVGLNFLDGANFLSVAGIYQWVFDLSPELNLDGGLSWYVGPGAQLLLVEKASAILVGGEIGLDYNFKTLFDVPFIIAIDTRPMFNLGVGRDFSWGARLSAHYIF
jgi:hypothetical protein